MKVKTDKTVTVHLTLTEDEARWLMGYVHNPMCDLSDEPERDSKMRTVFFDSIKSRLGN